MEQVQPWINHDTRKKKERKPSIWQPQTARCSRSRYEVDARRWDRSTARLHGGTFLTYDCTQDDPAFKRRRADRRAAALHGAGRLRTEPAGPGLDLIRICRSCRDHWLAFRLNWQLGGACGAGRRAGPFLRASTHTQRIDVQRLTRRWALAFAAASNRKESLSPRHCAGPGWLAVRLGVLVG